jgi:hypothetical protein
MASSPALFKVHPEVFDGYPQEAEAFPSFPRCMPVVLFVRPPDGPQVRMLRSPQQFQPLVNKDIMHKKIRHTITGDPEADIKKIIEILPGACIHQCDCGKGKYEKEIIIAFQLSSAARVMVIAVQYP